MSEPPSDGSLPKSVAGPETEVPVGDGGAPLDQSRPPALFQGDGGDVVPAWALPETRADLARRGRRLGERVFLGFVTLLLGDVLLSRAGHIGPIGLVAAIVACGGGVVVLWALIKYLGVVRLRRTLRREPWQEWTGCVSAVRLYGCIPGRVVAMVHDDWHQPVVGWLGASLRPTATTTEAHAIWVAGDPDGAFAVSTRGGGDVALVHRVRPGRYREQLAARWAGALAGADALADDADEVDATDDAPRRER